MKRPEAPTTLGRCPKDGKVSWTTRKQAKAAMRRTEEKSDHVLQVYPCETYGVTVYHVGSVAGMTREDHRRIHGYTD